MKINANSWHYRYMNWLQYPPPRNLCAYFWSVVFLVLLGWACIPVFWWIDRPYNNDPGLLRSWARARKEKLCPLIEFVNGRQA